MSGRSWEENRYEGGLGDLADDDDAFDDSGTIDLGSGTVGGEFSVGDDGNTYSDDEVAADDDVVRTGNDTVTDTSPVPRPSAMSGNQGIGDTAMLAIGAVVAVLGALALGGND